MTPHTLNMNKDIFIHIRKAISILILVAFISTSVKSPVYAQTVLNLPAPGTMVSLSSAYTPVLIKGLKINPVNPLAIDFIVATGNSQLTAQDPKLKVESEKLIKYFFASLTLPEKDMWVNLSPYEKSRIIPKATGETEMGRDMLAQDYILKQITASLIYPEKGLGKEFWNKVYSEASERFGTTQIPVNTFNKVWIVADKATVYEAKDTVFVVDSHLKVMLEEDYLALNKHQQVQPMNDTHVLGSKIVREIVLPALEKEVNEGKNFSPLRQIFYSLILAKWYKETLKTALLNQVYSNKNMIAGVDVADKSIKEKIYQQYLRAYKKGVFNYIKEDIDQTSKQTIPRKYFSGGEEFDRLTLTRVNKNTATPAMISNIRSLIVGTILLVSGLATTGLAAPATNANNGSAVAVPAISQGTNAVADQLASFNKFHPEQFGFVEITGTFSPFRINIGEAKRDIERGALKVDGQTGQVSFNEGTDSGYYLQLRSMDRHYEADMVKGSASDKVFITNVNLWVPADKVRDLIKSGAITVENGKYNLYGVTPEQVLGAAQNQGGETVVPTNIVLQAVQDQLNLFNKLHPEEYGFAGISLPWTKDKYQMNVVEVRKRIERKNLAVDPNTGAISFINIDPGYAIQLNSMNRFEEAGIVEDFNKGGDVLIGNADGLKLPRGVVSVLIRSGVITEENDGYYLGGATPEEVKKIVDGIISVSALHQYKDLWLFTDANGHTFSGKVDVNNPTQIPTEVGTADLNPQQILNFYVVKINGHYGLVPVESLQFQSDNQEVVKPLGLFNKYHPEEFGFEQVEGIGSMNVWEIRARIKAGILSVNSIGEVSATDEPSPAAPASVQNSWNKYMMAQGVEFDAKNGKVFIENVNLYLPVKSVKFLVGKGYITVWEGKYYLGGMVPAEASNAKLIDALEKQQQIDSIRTSSGSLSGATTNTIPQAIQDQLDMFNKYHPEEFGFVNVKGLGKVNVWEIRERVQSGTLSIDKTGEVSITQETLASSDGSFNAPFSVNFGWNRVMTAQGVDFDAKNGKVSLENVNLKLPVKSVKFLVGNGAITEQGGKYYLGGMLPEEVSNQELIKALEKQQLMDSVANYVGTDGGVYLLNADMSLPVNAVKNLIRTGNVDRDPNTGRFELVGMTAEHAKKLANNDNAMIGRVLSTWALMFTLIGTVNNVKASDASPRQFKKSLEAQNVEKLYSSLDLWPDMQDRYVPNLKELDVAKFRDQYLFSLDKMKDILQGKNPQDVYDFVKNNIPTKFHVGETWASQETAFIIKWELLRLVVEAGGLDQKAFLNDFTSDYLNALNQPDPVGRYSDFVVYLQRFYNWDDVSGPLLSKLGDPKSPVDGVKWAGRAGVEVDAIKNGIAQAKKDFGEDVIQGKWQRFEIDGWLELHKGDKAMAGTERKGTIKKTISSFINSLSVRGGQQSGIDLRYNSDLGGDNLAKRGGQQSGVILGSQKGDDKDKAMNGGIDLNASKIAMQRQGSGIQIKFNQAMIAQFKQGNFNGIVPIITGIKTIANIYPLLGLQAPEGASLS